MINTYLGGEVWKLNCWNIFYIQKGVFSLVHTFELVMLSRLV